MISFDSLSQQSQGLENFTKRMGEITNMGTTLKTRMKPEFVSMFESRLQEAMSATSVSKKNENVASVNFGTIDEYEDAELEVYADRKLVIDNVYGLRMFYALQRNELKTDDNWAKNMFEIECKAEQIPEFRDIAFFHHVILKHK